MPETITNEQLEWTIHPLRKDIKKSLFLIILLGLVAILVYFWGAAVDKTNAILLTGVSVIILFSSLTKYFFPTHYVLSEEGVEMKTTFGKLTRRWVYFRSFYPDRNGIFLSPFPKKSWLENFRGVYLIFNNNAQEVTKFIRAKINTQ
jgi:hypothetical protein